MSRLHERTLELLADELPPDAEGRRWSLRSPSPGWFRPLVAPLSWCGPGTAVGTLDILGRPHLLVVPPGIAGAAGDLAPRERSSGSSHAVAYRDPIVLLTSAPIAAAAGPGAVLVADAARTSAGLVFRAPTSGRFYGRSAPDKPPFVVAGGELAQGTTICLLEVMKTFHRVTYGGPGLPETARIRSVLIADGDDVNAGDPLLALE